MVGWINAATAYEGLEAAGANFDRAKVIAATNKLTDFTAGGLVQPVDWTRQHQPPTPDDPKTHGYKLECFAFVQVKGGTFQVVGDKAKPWTCWSNENRDWADPTPTNFQ
jgi:hypothetical protein